MSLSVRWANMSASRTVAPVSAKALERAVEPAEEAGRLRLGQGREIRSRPGGQRRRIALAGRQVLVLGPGALFGHQIDAAALGHQPSGLALGIGNVAKGPRARSEEHTSELQSRGHIVC